MAVMDKGGLLIASLVEAVAIEIALHAILYILRQCGTANLPS